MPKYPFLSDDWFVAVRQLQDEHDMAVPPEAEIKMNLMITETPFGIDRAIHMAAASGRADWGHGHLDDADVTMTLAYETAKAIFVGGNPQAAIEAFMAGKITMQGDITMLVVMQATPPAPNAPALAQAMQDITE